MDQKTPREDIDRPRTDAKKERDSTEAERPAGDSVSDEERPQPREDDRAQPQTDRAAPEQKAQKPEDDDAGGKPGPGFLRRHPVLVIAAIVLLIAAAVAGVLWWLHARHFESTDDAFIDARQFSISPKVAGYIVDVPVTDNQVLNAGDLIAQIDKRDYENAFAEAEARRKAAGDQIPNIDAQIAAQQAQVEQAQQQVNQSQAALQFAQQQFDRAQTLAHSGNGTVQNAQQQESNLLQAQADLARAQAAVSSAQKQILVLQAQRQSATASLSEAKAARDQAKLNLEYTSIRAAQPGRIAKLSAAQGQYVVPRQSLSMYVPYPLWVTANFKETQITDMRPGQPVDIEIDAYPGLKLHGHVDSIQPGSGTAFSLLPAENATGNYVKVVQRVPVKIVFESVPKDVTLGPGMSVVPTVRVR
jgi:membrane fusion protein (multidrug efflux system)